MITPLLLATQAWAAQLVLDADTRTLREGQVVTLNLTVVDGRPKGPPRIPDSKGLSFSYRGQRQSTVMVNFKTTRTVTYSYSMTALEPGFWEVGPVEMVVGGQALESNTLAIQVSERDTSAEIEGVTASLGTDDVWVGQTVVYHLEFRSPKQITDLRWTPPEFEGFVPEQTAEERQKEYTLRDGDRETTVIELDMPLVATAPGAREIPPAVLQAQYRVRRAQRRQRGIFDSLYQTENTIYTAAPLPTAVHPLPDAGRDEHWSGLIGDFRIRAELSAERVAVGESATLTVTVEGDGTLSGFSLPELPVDGGFRAYDDQAEISGEVSDGRFRGTGVFRRAIVPEAEGVITIPPITLQFFSPSAGAYRSVSTRSMTLEVRPGERSEALTSYAERGADVRRDVEDLGADILPIHPEASLRSQVFDPASPGVLLPVGLPLMALLGVGLRDATARRRDAAPDRRRALRARIEGVDRGDLGALEGLLREAIGLALGCPAGAVERSSLEGLPEGIRAEAEAVYGALEEARYGGGGVDAELARRVLELARKLAELG